MNGHNEKTLRGRGKIIEINYQLKNYWTYLE